MKENDFDKVNGLISDWRKIRENEYVVGEIKSVICGCVPANSYRVAMLKVLEDYLLYIVQQLRDVAVEFRDLGINIEIERSPNDNT